MSPLDEAIRAAGGSAAKLAELIGEKTAQVVHNWRSRGVPADKCLRISQAVNGAVTCHDLRPDVFPPTEKPKPKTKAA